MSVSVPGIISALSMKPMSPMLARSIANNFASLVAETATSVEHAAGATRKVDTAPDPSAPGHLDQRA